MSQITTLLWDIGGVFLSNGWDLRERRRVAERFGLNFPAFEAKHEAVVDAFERGRISEDDYWRQTALASLPAAAAGGGAPPSLAELRAAMRAESQPLPASLALLAELAAAGRWRIAALNNESRELNLYRIETFGLARWMDVFLSSCFLGARKPGGEIFDRALEMLQKRPEECVFTDDRPENLDYPRRRGCHVIRFASAEQLRSDLARLGVAPRA